MDLYHHNPVGKTGRNSCSGVYFKPLIHGQINLIKFIELNKFGNVYSKIWHVFVWTNQLDQSISSN